MARVRRRARPCGAWGSAGLTDRWTESGPLREAKGPRSRLLSAAWPPTQDCCRGDAPLKTAARPTVRAGPWLLRASPWAPGRGPQDAQHTPCSGLAGCGARPPATPPRRRPHTDPGRQTGGGGGQGRLAHGCSQAPPGLLRPVRRGGF